MTIINKIQKTIQKLLKPTELSIIDYQIKRKEEQGIEVKPIFLSHRNKTIRHYYQVNPLDRLRQKNIITDSEFISAKQYQHDFELSNQTHHARMSYDSILTSGGRSEARELEEKHLKASENVFRVSKLIGSFDQFIVLELLIEKQIMLQIVRVELGYHSRTKNSVEKIAKEVCQLLDNYYSN